VEALAVYQASQVRPLGNRRCIQFEVLSATSRRLEVSMRAAGPPAGPRVLSDLVRSWRTLLLAMAAVLFLTGPSCTATDPETTESLPDPSATTPTTQTPTARAGQGAKAYLPDTSTWSFAVDDEDLIPWVDPIGHGIELIQDALSDKKAPRAFADKPSKFNRLGLAVQLSASAIKCLNEHGHLELHAYTDTEFRYSVAVVLVIDAKAYRDVAVPLCAISDFFLFPRKARPAVPSLSPCVGATQKDRYVVAWMASTDVMCKALGGGLEPSKRRSELHRGDAGPDVANLQFNLNEVGYSLEVDGSFGPKTESALNRFQECYPYRGAVSGVADEATEAALRSAQGSDTICAG
jgi:hypothetical protein